jgi:hypothetical protein
MLNLATLTDPTNDTPTTGLKDISFEIKASTYQPHEYTLVLKGFLAPGWTGRLANGLAQQRIGIVMGEAEKVTASAWQATFKLKSSPLAKDPLSIDYACLANTELPTERSRDKIALRDFLMEPCSRHQGSLYLEIKGVDRLGFLGDLLDYFSMRCLFPVKMVVETAGDSAVDRFWLRGMGGSVPSESVAIAMKENLTRLLVSNA